MHYGRFTSGEWQFLFDYWHIDIQQNNSTILLTKKCLHPKKVYTRIQGIQQVLIVKFCFSFFRGSHGLSLFFFLQKTVSLKCYKCLSTKSWDDCASVQKAVACDSDEDTCVKIHYDAKSVDMAMSVESYVKYCHPKLSCDKDLCKTLVLPKGATVNKCKMNCCEGNLCNGARVPLVSAILLLACAALTFFC